MSLLRRLQAPSLFDKLSQSSEEDPAFAHTDRIARVTLKSNLQGFGGGSFASTGVTIGMPPPTMFSSASFRRFTWNLVTTDSRVVAYKIYKGRYQDNSGIATLVDVIMQPPNIKEKRQLTWTDQTNIEGDFYWISSVNAAGTESPRVAAVVNNITHLGDGGDTIVQPTKTWTDFSDLSTWIPLYSSIGTVTFSATGAMTVKTTGADTTNLWHSCGVRPRFTLFPDSTGVIEFQFRIQGYVHQQAAGDNCVIGFGCPLDMETMDVGGIGSIGNVTARLHRLRTTSWALTAINNLNSTSALAAFTTLDLKMKISNDTTASPQKVYLGSAGAGAGVFLSYSLDAGSFTDFATSTNNSAIALNAWRGFQVYLGMFGTTRLQDFEGTFTEFKLNQGTAVFGGGF